MTITVQSTKQVIEIPEGSQLKIQLGEEWYSIHYGMLWEAIKCWDKTNGTPRRSHAVNTIENNS